MKLRSGKLTIQNNEKQISKSISKSIVINNTLTTNILNNKKYSNSIVSSNYNSSSESDSDNDLNYFPSESECYDTDEYVSNSEDTPDEYVSNSEDSPDDFPNNNKNKKIEIDLSSNESLNELKDEDYILSESHISDMSDDDSQWDSNASSDEEKERLEQIEKYKEFNRQKCNNSQINFESDEKDNSNDNKQEPIITCEGCLYDMPGQMAHMDYGGCLYQDYSDLLE